MLPREDTSLQGVYPEDGLIIIILETVHTEIMNLGTPLKLLTPNQNLGLEFKTFHKKRIILVGLRVKTVIFSRFLF